METGKIEIWNENKLEEIIKGLESGVPFRPVLPSTLSEWLDGCPLDRLYGQGLHTS